MTGLLQGARRHAAAGVRISIEMAAFSIENSTENAAISIEIRNKTKQSHYNVIYGDFYERFIATSGGRREPALWSVSY